MHPRIPIRRSHSLLLATVKRENFKTCDQSGFCKRNRAYADTASSLGSSFESPYGILPDSITFKDGILQGTILKSIGNGNAAVRLPLTVTFLESGTARVTVDEEKRQKGDIELRHGSVARKERYNEAADWAIVGGLEVSSSATLSGDKEEGITKIIYGAGKKHEAVIRHKPFGIDFKRDGQTQIKFNDRGLLNVEHWRAKVEKAEGESNATPDQEDQSTWWDEVFGGNTDSKPKGPESVALDISFPGYEHVFGIPEHTGPLSLKETRGANGQFTEPYRMYNSDVFEYEMDSPMTLYGSIPFMQAHRKDSTVGVFWLNGAETWVDIIKSKASSNPLSLGIGSRTDTQTHWLSESGLLDVFVFLGPTPKDISKSYGELTGYTQLPQQFAIAYHQCRWNYVSDEDVKDVDRKFDKHRIPYDVIWLDIEYTEGKKYFTWDPLTFSDPKSMQEQLDEHDRKLVAIIDPHIKNVPDYSIVDEMKSNSFAVKNKDGNIYEGWCWPGSSYWVDCFNPAAIKWWQDLFKYSAWKDTLPNLWIWNDMNEPSVFNGPETTMPKDNLHHGNWEHRDVHNINGLTLVNATYRGLQDRSKKGNEPRRPFILTRSFYAGSQRMGAMWTGDNQAEWPHLAASIPMVLANGIAGFPFAGADVGGFFGNPSKELLTRWYQAGTFYPFFRGHAHIDTRRREPYLAGEPYTSIIASAIRLRYQLLPAWYTAFHEAATDGLPILRPQYWMFPSDERGFSIDDQFHIGSTGLLAKPVTSEGASSVDIYLADDATYYDYWDFTLHKGSSSGGSKTTVAAPLEKIPLLIRAGHIVPRRDRERRSSGLMRHDPFTLLITLDSAGSAEGTLYFDDGETLDHEAGAFVHRRFALDGAAEKLSSTDLASNAGAKTAAYVKSIKDVRVEKVILVGVPDSWREKTGVSVSEDGDKKKSRTAKLEYHTAEAGKAAWAVVRDPAVGIGREWTIDFSQS
ncbi:MAG: nucleoside diphosphate kinase [Chaenotheca gracillima]|nr:MAG: nucleoside diphosphate kinase [Chaenotheca gracillima]